MPWIRLDDQFFANPKVVELGKDAKLVYLAALTYCGSQLTAGVIKAGAVRMVAAMVDAERECVAELVDAGLWEVVDDGWWIVSQDRGQDDRNSAKNRNWRRAVLTRDSHTCQDCGCQDVHLHVHHLFPYADYPEMRTDHANGVTLCADCHGQRHGRRLS